jgi:hypothetical protein
LALDFPSSKIFPAALQTTVSASLGEAGSSDYAVLVKLKQPPVIMSPIQFNPSSFMLRKSRISSYNYSQNWIELKGNFMTYRVSIHGQRWGSFMRQVWQH